MKLKALFLNCTLKYSPETSNTRAFIEKSAAIFKDLNVATEIVRITDYHIKFGTSSDEGPEDDWPFIFNKIKETDIFIMATPVWRGDRSSVAKLVSERLDGLFEDKKDKNEQYPTYNKVAGMLVDGNEDGAKKAISSILFDLAEHGFTLAVNPFSYYVGKAGPGPSYIEAKGDKHEFTNNMLLIMAQNMVHLASVLKENPYRINLSSVKKKAAEISN
ncbi:flavodoxin family protein [Galbibacter pacificus]|uniref:Flavodoxin family protein n=1 Tax=Galbibacter pacificus TaxID=2996052 RepID=A0ABT6FPZ4_9FLAO|nr:flavodoxin family protein [Galbibacter pacificus]MDG3582292.1 flavodoxin family protein [Galbibacter pacificus]MDG3585232.1 flavodoxin family protein [Galbibacter pacificus]